MWNEIKNNQDIGHLLEAFGGFHDSCIKEAMVKTGRYVNQDFSMALPDPGHAVVRLLIQRQAGPLSTIELWFEAVHEYRLCEDDGDGSIFDAAFFIKDGLIHWADYERWTPEKEVSSSITYIVSQRLKWRDRNDWLGNVERYGELKN